MYELEYSSVPDPSKKGVKSPSRVSVVHRPCGECKYFRSLSARYGVCDMHEAPSLQRECFVFKRRVS